MEIDNLHREVLLKEFKAYDITTPYFSLKGVKTYARVVSIYDGDTITVVIPILNSQYYKFNLRLMGIDTSEIRDKDENKRKMALKARNRLYELITKCKCDDLKHKEIEEKLNDDIYLIWVECDIVEKYGRTLAHVKINEEDTETLVDILINEGLGVRYDGGAR